MEQVQYWQWCLVNTELVNLNWQHRYWSECITQWIITWISSNKYSFNDEFKWIHFECNSTQSYEIIVNKLNNADVWRINNSLDYVYFAQANDIISCPRSGWDYAGFMSDKFCRSALVWEKWEYSWKLPSQMSIIDKSSIMLRNISSLNFETLSYLNDVSFGKPWPNWSIVIFKDGGWDKMVWTNCNYKFCWFCFGDHDNQWKSENNAWIIPRIFTPLLSFICWLILAMKLYIQVPNFISQVQECSEALVQIASYIFVVMWCFTTLSIELMLVYLSLHSQNEDPDEPEPSNKKSTFIILSVMYPIAWCFGFYLIFIQN